MERQAYGIQEFGDLFDLSKSTISKMVLSGEIKSAWVGGRRLIPVEEVKRFAADLRERAGVAVAV